MARRETLPSGWRISGYGPLGEGVEAAGPYGQRVIAATDEELVRVVRDQRIEEKENQ